MDASFRLLAQPTIAIVSLCEIYKPATAASISPASFSSFPGASRVRFSRCIMWRGYAGAAYRGCACGVYSGRVHIRECDNNECEGSGAGTTWDVRAVVCSRGEQLHTLGDTHSTRPRGRVP
jgi:hypothetical protein